MSDRVSTGVPGLDELLGGGLPKNVCVLLCGGPGTGKTIMAAQFLYKGAKELGEPGIFVTLNEDPEEIRGEMKSFNWDLSKLEKASLLAFIDARPFKVTNQGYITRREELFKGEKVPFSHVSRLIFEETKRIGANRMVLDSLNVLSAQYEQAFDVRQGVLGLIHAIKKSGCTSLLLLESMTRPEREARMEEYLAHGCIYLGYGGGEEVTTRAAQVLKMRGIQHDDQPHPMAITGEGIVIHSREKVFGGLR